MTKNSVKSLSDEQSEADRGAALPRGWKWVKLREVLHSLESGARPPGGAIGITDGVPSLSAEHMTPNGKFDFSTMRYVPRDFYASMVRGHIQRNDVLVVKDGATTGKVVLADGDFPFAEAVVNEHVFVCRPDPQIVDPRWLFYWLWNPTGYALIRDSYQGAAIGGINQRFADKVPVPLPPLSEQKRIAAILNEQLAAVEKARKAAEAELEAARALPAAYLRQVFNSDEAKKWPKKKLGEVCVKKTGNRDPRLSPSDTFMYVDITSVDNDAKRIASARGVLGEDAPSRARQVIRSGDVILSTTRPNLNAVAVVPEQLDNQICSTGFCVLRPTSQILTDYLFAFVQYPVFVNALSDLVKGALYPAVTDGQVRDQEIVLPNVEIQKRIAASLRDQMDRAAVVQKSIEAQQNTIDHLSNALLRKAFRGEL